MTRSGESLPNGGLQPSQGRTGAPPRELALKEPAYQTLEDYVFGSLKQAIVSLELAPGTEITLQTLEDRLGVSRTPIRQAIRRLADTGFVSVLPNRTMQIKPLAAAEAEELYDIRAVVEKLAIKRSVSRLETSHHRVLTDAFSRSEEAYRSGDEWEILRANRAFHHALYSACGMPKLLGMIGDLTEQCERYRWTELVLGSDNTLAREQHRQLAEAAVAGDAQAAVRLLDEHLKHARRTVVESLASQATSDEGRSAG